MLRFSPPAEFPEGVGYHVLVTDDNLVSIPGPGLNWVVNKCSK